MGIRGVFKKKEPTEDEIRDHLQHVGISTKNKGPGPRQEKFGAFKHYAQERAGRKPGLAPVNPYGNMNNANGNPYGGESEGGENPYAGAGGAGSGSNPYGGAPASGASQARDPYASGARDPYSQPSGARNPYASGASQARDPYSHASGASQARDPYSKPSLRDPYGLRDSYSRDSSSTLRDLSSNPYSTTSTLRDPEEGRSANPYQARASRASRPRQYDEESLDLNVIPSNIMGSKKPERDDETIDLNELPEEDDLNVVIDDLPQEQEVNSEDEEIEAIKQDIRFVKGESVASTRNTLRMAQEADASGTNTLGMLGSQSERLYNAEQNLNLADTQTNIAKELISTINRLNRTIFIPATGNPFNKKSRLRQQEDKIKAEKAQEKYMRESNRRNMYASEQRIKEGITNNATSSDTYQKYQEKNHLEAAKRYQFENDSEDDEMEKEIASNLDQIGAYAKKLNTTARTMNTEVEQQNERLGKIEEDADRLDINVHLNNTRLSNIR